MSTEAGRNHNATLGSVKKFLRRSTSTGTVDVDLAEGSPEATWRRTSDLQEVLSGHLFVENDQVVVPSLNLKSAKRVLCRNERQKRALRQLGFIEDRIRILNLSQRQW